MFLDLSSSVYSVLLNAARRAAKKIGAIFINKLDIRLFGYSISERARAPILCEKRTVQYKSIADGLMESENIEISKIRNMRLSMIF